MYPHLPLKNLGITKAMIHSPDRETNFFDIVAGVLQGVTLAPYLFIICLDYVLQTSISLIKENGFTLKIALHYLSIKESTRQRFTRVYIEIRHKQLKFHNMTGPHSPA